MASTKMFTKNHQSSNTSSNSFFHQQTSSSSTTNQPIDEDITLTQEMHVKMAKKIAQLTKVSYEFLIYLFVNKRKSTMSLTNNIHCVERKV